MNLILITTKINSENELINEVLSFFILKNVKFEERKAVYGGVVLFFTDSPYFAYNLLISSVLSYPMKIYPLLSSDELLKVLKKSEISVKYVNCEVRGVRKDLCKELEEKIKKEIKFDRKSDIVLHIQGIKDYYGYSVLKRNCENYSKLLENEELRKSCFSFMREKILKI
ncbi:MAG: hypothetical protein ACP5ML_03475 [Fervidicoccus sp.]